MEKINTPSKYQLGYSLIELLVSIGIIAILSTVGVIGFSNYNRIQQVSQTATNIELLINQARGNAQSVVKELRTVKRTDGSTAVLVNCVDGGGTNRKINSYIVERKPISPNNEFMVMSLVCDGALGPEVKEARYVKLP